MNQEFKSGILAELDAFRRDGVYKILNYLDSPQASRVRMEGRGEVIILSSNNYVGLCDETSVIEAGKRALERFGAGTASVRFICGTFSIHRELENKLASFVGTEAALSYVSCWNANTGLMPCLLSEKDLLVSDELNHASIIDGARLARTNRKVYPHSDMKALEEILESAATARRRMIISDGVFSMEGDLVRLPDILEIAQRHNAIVVVDDSHATGVMGKTGRGTAEHFGVLGEVDIITSTLGKALGGAAGGFTAASAAVCDYLTQRSRPQLFSNALPPTVAASSLAALECLETHPERVTRLHDNARYFRQRLIESGFKPVEGQTPIIPVILGDTALAIKFSHELLNEGVFVTGFGYPVVPQGQARVRCQVSAAHARADLDQAIEAFKKVAARLHLKLG